MISLDNRPETFRTYLKNEYKDITQLNKIRRKFSRDLRKGYICARKIPSGHRHLQKIYFNIPKSYFIIFTKKDCYYCENINTEKDTIKSIKSFKLNNNKWLFKGDISINLSEVILCF